VGAMYCMKPIVERRRILAALANQMSGAMVMRPAARASAAAQSSPAVKAESPRSVAAAR